MLAASARVDSDVLRRRIMGRGLQRLPSLNATPTQLRHWTGTFRRTSIFGLARFGCSQEVDVHDSPMKASKHDCGDLQFRRFFFFSFDRHEGDEVVRVRRRRSTVP